MARYSCRLATCLTPGEADQLNHVADAALKLFRVLYQVLQLFEEQLDCFVVNVDVSVLLKNSLVLRMDLLRG
jgi:hypothetical protein